MLIFVAISSDNVNSGAHYTTEILDLFEYNHVLMGEAEQVALCLNLEANTRNLGGSTRKLSYNTLIIFEKVPVYNAISL